MTKQRLFSLSPAAPERFRAQGIALDVVQSTGSTNDDLKEYLKSAAQPVLPRVRLAYEQTAGRGTRGHRWHNVTDAMLFSVAVSGVPIEGAISIRAGLAVAEVIREQLGIALSLKWPNDLWLEGAKAGGILSEVVDSGAPKLVIGIGINLHTPEVVRLDKWSMRGLFTDREAIAEKDWDTIFLRLITALIGKIHSTVPALPQEWEKFDAFRGESLRVVLPEKVLVGRNCGIDISGNLLLETGAGVQSIRNGSIFPKL